MITLQCTADVTSCCCLSHIHSDSLVQRMTTETFTEFCATADARNTIQLNIRKYCLMLCDALELDFASRNRGKVGRYDAPKYKFYIQEGGRKYHKIVMEYENGQQSVHAFVDKKTGEVYKAASFKSPAKGVRYNLLEINSREECLRRADWAGAYLYVR